jgi:methyl-accepting chemotaxis protein
METGSAGGGVMAGPTTESLSIDLKALTREVAAFRGEFNEFRGRMENTVGFLKWLGTFLATATLGLIGTVMMLTWEAAKRDARGASQTAQFVGLERAVASHSDRLDRVDRSLERAAAGIEALTGRFDQLERAVASHSDRLDRVDRSLERAAANIEALTGRIDRLERAVESQSERLDKLGRSVERTAGSVEALTKALGGRINPPGPEKPRRDEEPRPPQ